jgi:DNA-directed RNA polymerase III subunit RPC3
VFSYLLQYGRQPLPKIVQNTRLQPGQVRHSLAVLIQHHLVYYYEAKEEGTTYYEADWRNAYSLVRAGKIIQLVEQRLGECAARVISVILDLGHVKVRDLLTVPELLLPTAKKRKQAAKTNGLNGGYMDGDNVDEGLADEEEAGLTNGMTDHQDSMHQLLQRTLHQLASYGYIVNVRNAHLVIPADTRREATRRAKAIESERGGHKTAKKLEDAIEENAKKWVKDQTNGTISCAMFSDGPPRGIKRRAAALSTAPARKKAKLEDIDRMEEGDSEDQLTDNDLAGDESAAIDVSLRACFVGRSHPAPRSNSEPPVRTP